MLSPPPPPQSPRPRGRLYPRFSQSPRPRGCLRPRPLSVAPPRGRSPSLSSLRVPGSGGSVLRGHWPDYFRSVLHRSLPCNGVRAGKSAAAGASLPPCSSRPQAGPSGSGSEEGIPRRLPLPEGVRAAAPSAVPAAARAPVGDTSGRVSGWRSHTLGLPPAALCLRLMRPWIKL